MCSKFMQKYNNKKTKTKQKWHFIRLKFFFECRHSAIINKFAKLNSFKVQFLSPVRQLEVC